MNNLNTIQSNKNKNIIISVVVILLIVGGLFYFKTFQKEKVEETAISNGNEVVSPEESIKNENTNLSTNVNPGSVTTNIAKFDSLLISGSKAFMDKNYSLAIKIYNEALALDDSTAEVVYIRLYSIYNAQGDNKKAEEMLNKAIAKKPIFTDYWVTKLTFLNEKTNTSFADLKMIYEDGLKKVDSKTKVNLVTTFAVVAENNKQYTEAISAWTKAIELYPQSKAIYQAEIDRLKTM